MQDSVRIIVKTAQAMNNLFLIGLMGAGKTSVGRQLARRLHWAFFDSDKEIENRTGVGIPTIFEYEGEPGFRAREASIIEELTSKHNIVLATGGGSVLDSANREHLQTRGHIILLNVSVDEQLARTRLDKNRPLLQTQNPRTILEQLREQRLPVYRSIANLEINSNNRNMKTVVEKICRYLHQQQSNDGPWMKTKTCLNVALGTRSYPIYIGGGLLQESTLIGQHIRGHKVMVISNETVAPLYLERTLQSLSNVDTKTLILPDGEQYKTLDTLNQIYQYLLEQRFDRNSTLIALGGGVIGDLVGFAAASYQRGIDFIQIPTTLLAQVDSSVGGKTGVNHALGKNMIGAFYQPRCVIADTDTLSTLDDAQLSAGLAEVIKYGVIDSIDFFTWVESNIEALLSRKPNALAYAIEKSCAYKARIVAEDEREQGKRALLNLGHTFGHAIETASGYGNWLHGEAVAAGMCMAAQLSQNLGWIEAEQTQRLRKLLTTAGLPIEPPADMNPQQFIDLMSIDKKVRDGVLNLVLLKGIGKAVVSGNYSHKCLQKTLAACYS